MPTNMAFKLDPRSSVNFSAESEALLILFNNLDTESLLITSIVLILSNILAICISIGTKNARKTKKQTLSSDSETINIKSNISMSI